MLEQINLKLKKEWKHESRISHRAVENITYSSREHHIEQQRTSHTAVDKLYQGRQTVPGETNCTRGDKLHQGAHLPGNDWLYSDGFIIRRLEHLWACLGYNDLLLLLVCLEPALSCPACTQSSADPSGFHSLTSRVLSSDHRIIISLLCSVQTLLQFRGSTSLPLHLAAVEGFVCPNDPKIYAVESIAACRVSLVGQVKGEGPDQEDKKPLPCG